MDKNSDYRVQVAVRSAAAIDTGYRMVYGVQASTDLPWEKASFALNQANSDRNGRKVVAWQTWDYIVPLLLGVGSAEMNLTARAGGRVGEDGDHSVFSILRALELTRDAAVFEAVTRFLTQPVDSVVQRAAAQLASSSVSPGSGDLVAMHSRSFVDDRFRALERDTFVPTGQRLTRPNRTVFVISGDSEDKVEEMKAQLSKGGAKGVIVPPSYDRETAEGGQGALVTILLLNAAPTFLGTTDSSFSWVSVHFGGWDYRSSRLGELDRAVLPASASSIQPLTDTYSDASEIHRMEEILLVNTTCPPFGVVLDRGKDRRGLSTCCYSLGRTIVNYYEKHVYQPIA